MRSNISCNTPMSCGARLSDLACSPWCDLGVVPEESTDIEGYVPKRQFDADYMGVLLTNLSVQRWTWGSRSGFVVPIRAKQGTH